MIDDFENTEEDYKLEESRYFAAQVAGFYRNVKGRERLELSATASAQTFLEDAIPLVAEGITAAFEHEEAKGSAGTVECYPTLRNLDPMLLAVIAVSRCMDARGSRSSISNMNVKIGKAVEANIFADIAYAAFAQQHPAGGKAFNKIVKRSKEKYSDFDRRVHYVRNQVGKRGLMIGHTAWTDVFCSKVGLWLFSIVQRTTDIFEIYQVWRKTKITSSQDRLGFTKEIQDQIDAKNLKLDWHAPAYRPMVVRPNDWTANAEHYGPYMDYETAVNTPLVKNCLPLQKARLTEQLKHGYMQECLDALNTLQRVPYKINTFTFEALEWVVDSLLDEPLVQHGKFPPLSAVDVPDETDDNKTGPEAQKRWRKIIRQKLVESSMVQVKADMAEAKSLMDRPDRPFWQPHHFDTRGRVYHVAAFGHHRNDYIRGQFLFADLRLVTPSNVHNLYYQVANTWAGPVSDTDSRKTDKIPLEERVQWTKDNMEKLMAVGKDFVTGFDHWSVAGEQFQHLAACRELYLSHNPDKTLRDDYKTGLPIGFDGANSGLQHYSMASKWKSDAYKVNLVPDPQPQDCYQYVADYSTAVAEKAVAKDPEILEALGHDFDAEHQLNAQRWLDHGIDRKVTKPNCMTFCYSVTKVGMADQLRDDIMDDITAYCDDNDEPHPFGDDNGFKACNSMARINWHSISKVIESGAAGMDFMRDLADALASDGKHLQWTSLIGFPCAQEYTKEVVKRPKGFLFDRQGGKNYRMTLKVSTDELHRGESMDGAAPNFVHHLDSTHLMMAVNKAKDYGVTNLMVVHDSFATDIEAADQMLTCIKVAAIEMYEEQCHFQNVLDDARALVTDPDRPAEKEELRLVRLQMKQEVAAETDKEAAAVLAKQFEQQIKALERRIIRWPEVPPKGEGDNALDLWQLPDCPFAFS